MTIFVFMKRVALLAMTTWLSACATNMSAPVVGPGASTSRSSGAPMPQGAGGANGYYVVQPGDTLNRIAQQFGHSFHDVAAWNGLTDPDTISVGQTLRVAPPDGVIVTPVNVGAPAIGGMPSVSPGAQSAPAEAEPAKPGVKSEPVAIVEPYSEAAWAKINAAPAAPAAAPVLSTKTPVVSTPDPSPAVDAASAWIWPARGKVVTTFSNGETKGIDIAGELGDAVRASSGGRVVYAGAGLRGYGKLVIIKHDADFLSAYAHNNNLLVKEGQTVKKGQTIAELGSTDADRPKLHFEIRRRGKPVDPLKYLPNR